MEVGGREIIYLSLHCHHQNDSCIKMGSDESHFNVPVGSDRQSHKTVSTNLNLFGDSVAGAGGVYLSLIHYPRYPLFFFPLARVCVCERERGGERESVYVRIR